MRYKCIILLLLTLLFLASGGTAWSETAVTGNSLSPGGVGQGATTASLVKVAVGLAFVVLAIFASAWFFRRFGKGAFLAHRDLRVIGGLSLGQRERVVLLQVGKEQILLGVSPGRIQPLHVLSEPISADSADGDFSNKLNVALKNWKRS